MNALEGKCEGHSEIYSILNISQIQTLQRGGNPQIFNLQLGMTRNTKWFVCKFKLQNYRDQYLHSTLDENKKSKTHIIFTD